MAKRYIDADKLTDKLEELQFNAPVMLPVMKIYNVIELVEDQPTADVVEVVRCSECVNGKKAVINDKGFKICPVSGMEITDNDYCSYGERRTDDD